MKAQPITMDAQIWLKGVTGGLTLGDLAGLDVLLIASGVCALCSTADKVSRFSGFEGVIRDCDEAKAVVPCPKVVSFSS